jgi:hypothetical protein
MLHKVGAKVRQTDEVDDTFKELLSYVIEFAVLKNEWCFYVVTVAVDVGDAHIDCLTCI